MAALSKPTVLISGVISKCLFINCRVEVVTDKDVDRARHHLPPEVDAAAATSGQTPTEEHTNIIPHIPNYWAPEHKNDGISMHYF